MVIEKEVLIKAEIGRVWDVFTDLASWNNWCTAVGNVSSDTGRLEKGVTFKFCIRPLFFPMNIKPFVEEIIVRKRIVWSGSKHGVSARHEFIFEEQNGSVVVTSRESFKLNPFICLFFHIPQKKLHKLSVLLLNELKKAAENRIVSQKQEIMENDPKG